MRPAMKPINAKPLYPVSVTCHFVFRKDPKNYTATFETMTSIGNELSYLRKKADQIFAANGWPNAILENIEFEYLMTLPFMTTFPKGLARIGGKPTQFVPKIWRSVLTGLKINAGEFLDSSKDLTEEDSAAIKTVKPKIHTFREDPKDLWYPGRFIHMVINNRTKNRKQFVPVLLCVSTQKVEIKYRCFQGFPGLPVPFVFVDDKQIKEEALEQLVVNDGFESVEDFFGFFHEDFTGKIIHWTDLKY